MGRTTVSFFLQRELQKFKLPSIKKFALSTYYRRMYKRIPFESGVLADNVSIEDDGIHFRGRQAHYLYRGILMVSPSTGSSWAKFQERKVPTDKQLKYSHEQHPLACAEWGKVTADLEGDAISKEIKNYILSMK